MITTRVLPTTCCVQPQFGAVHQGPICRPGNSEISGERVWRFRLHLIADHGYNSCQVDLITLINDLKSSIRITLVEKKILLTDREAICYDFMRC